MVWRVGLELRELFSGAKNLTPNPFPRGKGDNRWEGEAES
jgi:hypothetical protein